MGAAALLTGLATGRPARADELQVAVASNFAPTLQKLAPLFAARTGHSIVQSAAASGQLAAQIANGAPFQVLLSADSERPKELEAKGLAVKGSRFTYAEGRLVLWSPKAGRVDGAGEVLTKPNLGTVALADPRVAPYGAAAVRVLKAKNVWSALSAKKQLALGTSITQAHQFVATGNADVGFVALAQVVGEDGSIAGSSWLVPQEQAGPILQQAVLLEPGRDSAAARTFLSFLRSAPEARATISAAGYELPHVPGGLLKVAPATPEQGAGGALPDAAGAAAPAVGAGVVHSQRKSTQAARGPRRAADAKPAQP